MLAVGMGGVSIGAGATSGIDPAFLPIGDGKVTTAGPRRGYVYSCGSGFAGGPGGGPGGPGGAQAEGPWIHDDGTFDLTAKATVDGSVRWRNAGLRKRTGAKRRTMGYPRVYWRHEGGQGSPGWQQQRGFDTA